MKTYAMVSTITNLVTLILYTTEYVEAAYPEFLVDITDYEGVVVEGMIYNSETNTFENQEIINE